jgi:outer membrane protein TolC
VYRAQVRIEQKLLALAQAQLQAGTVSDDAVQQARLALDASRQQLLSEQTSCDEDLHTLQNLTGLDAVVLTKELQAGSALWPALKAPSSLTALPASVVLSRPDVRAAYEQARAQSAAIGVQEAQLLPSFTLAGSIGLNNASLGGTAPWTRTWSFGPTLSIPTLDPRVVSFAKREAEASFQASQQTWRGTVRAAALDVQNALSALSQSQASLNLAGDTLSAQTRLAHLARAQQAAGTVPTQTALSAELSRTSSWLNHDVAQQTVLQAWISLFKATATSSY